MVVASSWDKHEVDVSTAGSLPLVQQSKPAGEKRRICATPVAGAPPSLQQRSAPAAGAEAQSATEQPNQPPAPGTAAPADAPAVQEPDEAQKSHDRLAQPSTVAMSDLATQEPQRSAQQREVTVGGGPACSTSAAQGSGGSQFTEGRPQANTAEAVSAVQDSGERYLLVIMTLFLHLLH